jgi:hypothetical protein
MLGFTIGEVAEINTTPDNEWFRSKGYNVFVRFLVRNPYQGYIFTDSRVKIGGLPIDIAGGSFLEVTRSTGLGVPTTATNAATGRLGVLWEKYAYAAGKPKATNYLRYDVFTKKDKGYFLPTQPAGDLIGELTLLVPKIREAFAKPGGLGDILIPTNLAARFDRTGGLGELVLPADLHRGLVDTLTNLNHKMRDIDLLVSNLNRTAPPLIAQLGTSLPPLLTNLTATLPPLLTNLDATLPPLLTNLNASLPGTLTQVDLTLREVRSNTLPAADKLLTNTADFVGGLKRHWLFRGAFKTNAPAKPR